MLLGPIDVELYERWHPLSEVGENTGCPGPRMPTHSCTRTWRVSSLQYYYLEWLDALDLAIRQFTQSLPGSGCNSLLWIVSSQKAEDVQSRIFNSLAGHQECVVHRSLYMRPISE
jgi:hypothetical protein